MTVVGLCQPHKVQQDHMQDLAPGLGHPKHKYRLGGERLESIPEEDLGVLVAEKFDNPATCGHSPETHSGLHQMKSGQQAKGGNSSTLLRSCKTPPAVLCSALGLPA